MTNEYTPPRSNEFELTLFGPGYGESLVFHIGDGSWVIVDSFLTDDDTPRAIRYLENIGVDPVNSVCLVVATHWHDDHIRGVSDLIVTCQNAKFCCASTLLKHEFLAAVNALENRHLTVTGSGAREIYKVFEHLKTKKSKPLLALTNRRIFTQGDCEIWSLSPDDKEFVRFLQSIGSLFPSKGQSKSRIPDQSPNQVSVVLWVALSEFAVLLGADLEKRGWVDILRSNARPNGKASVFKVPHHGSSDSDEPNVWKTILEPKPISVLTPWARGRGCLPRLEDVQRILSNSREAYITAPKKYTTQKPIRRPKLVETTIKESGVKLQQITKSDGAIRLRRLLNPSANWTVELFGSARHL